MNKRTLGLLAALGATLIYGFNHTIAKNVMPTYIQPFGFIFLRVFGAAILFYGSGCHFKLRAAISSRGLLFQAWASYFKLRAAISRFALLFSSFGLLFQASGCYFKLQASVCYFKYLAFLKFQAAISPISSLGLLIQA